MELLLLVLIIPLIPFYIISTLFSAWIFALGIPFIIFTAIVTFLRGFFQALFSRNVLPKLQALQEQFSNMRKSGDWREPPPSSLHSIRSRVNGGSNPTTTSEPSDATLSEMIQHQIMNRFHQSSIQTPSNFVLSLIPKFLLPTEEPARTPVRSPRSPLVNPISPIINGIEREEHPARKLEMPSFLDELVLEAEHFNQKDTTYDSVAREIPQTKSNELKDKLKYVYDKPQYHTVYDKSVMDKKYDYFDRYEPKDTVSESIYHSVYSQSQVKSNYQSTITKNFLDELADLADIEISPSESASRNDSEEMNDGGEATDAAKLLYMFKARNMMLADGAQVDRVDAIFS
ncbi:hypothetical protein HDV06_003526 [Boothiomyces sp. JEL0866]|nr:hypothetical protein HDV06_003526 [Boothiomyces sp. JEL0866]